MNKEEMKKAVAKAALDYIELGTIVGVGSGSTANYFIDELAKIKHKIDGAVASSSSTEKKLKFYNIPVYDLNSIFPLPLYIDSADEINASLQMIKGGGGALTREKIVAAVAQKFVCMADQDKKIDILGAYPLPIEVIPMARSYVAREVVKLGGHPVYREGFITDNGNVILDVWHLKIMQPTELEKTINNITGVVANGLFAVRSADILLLGTGSGVEKILL